MFNDFYGIYKDARDAVWRFLIDYHVDRLPVDLKAITDMLGIKVAFDDNNILYPNQKGTTLTDESATYIIIRRGGTPAENKYTVIHELGHGYFGHPLVDSNMAKHLLMIINTNIRQNGLRLMSSHLPVFYGGLICIPQRIFPKCVIFPCRQLG